jgi:hypothetical protein
MGYSWPVEIQVTPIEYRAMAMMKTFYRGATAAIIVYDTTQ